MTSQIRDTDLREVAPVERRLDAIQIIVAMHCEGWSRVATTGIVANDQIPVSRGVPCECRCGKPGIV